MKSDKKQTMILIGVSLLVIAAVMVYIALSQPRVYVEETVQSVQASSTTLSNSAESDDAVPEAPVEAAEPLFPINLNTATVQELMQIDGVGEYRANAIIEYREVLGGYTSVEQIKEISGFGDAVYEQLAPYLTV